MPAHAHKRGVQLVSEQYLSHEVTWNGQPWSSALTDHSSLCYNLPSKIQNPVVLS